MKFPWLKLTAKGASAATQLTARFVQPPSALLRVASLLLAVYLIYHAWDFFIPPKPTLSPALRDVVSRVIPQIITDLRSVTPHSAALLHIEGDSTDYFTNSLRQAIEANNALDLRDTTFGEKIRDMLRMRQPSYGSPDAALARGESLGAPAALFGSLVQFSSDPSGEAILNLDLGVADIASKKVSFSKHYTEHLGGGILSGVMLPGNFSRFGLFNRLLAWAVIVMLLPVFTITFIRAMVRRESNAANAFTLGIYTVVDALLAYLFLGVDFHSVVSTILFIVIVAIVLVYNIAVMTFALRLET